MAYRRLTNMPGAETSPSLSPDGQTLAFVHRSGKKPDIWIQRAGGRNPIDLTPDCDRESYSPAFSPDGTLIAYGAQCGEGGLFVMGATGENSRRLVNVGSNPAWSPDGKEILYSTELVAGPYGRTGTSEIWAVELASGKTRKLSGTFDAIQPNVSPHGLRVAFWALPPGGSQRDIWTMPYKGLGAGEKPVPVTQDAAVDYNPVWAPDGRSLYFLSNRDGAMNLWRVPIDEATGRTLGEPTPEMLPAREVGGLALSRDGRYAAYVVRENTYSIDRLTFDTSGALTGKPEPVLESSQEMADFDVSADGKFLAFDSRGGAQDDLFLLESDGRNLRQLTDDVPRDRAPNFSPDGKRIAFHSDRSGRYQIWTIERDGSGMKPLSKATDLIIEAHWSPGRPRHRRQQRPQQLDPPARRQGRARPGRAHSRPDAGDVLLSVGVDRRREHSRGLPRAAQRSHRPGGRRLCPRTGRRREDGAQHGNALPRSPRGGHGQPLSPLCRDRRAVRDGSDEWKQAPRGPAPVERQLPEPRLRADLDAPATSSARPTTPTSGSAPRPRRPGDARKEALRMALERALKTKDIVLFNVAAIVGMRWIALAAANGPSSLFLWVLAAIVFFIPQGFAVTALSSAIPEEGGLYVWTSKAFGQRQGFLAGWLYWASNITYFPTLTLSTVVFALYIFGTRFAALEQSATYAAGASLALLAIALGLNIVGMKTGKWVQNIGGLAQWLPVARAARHRPDRPLQLRLGDADAGVVAHPGLRGASDRPLLRESLLRVRGTRACAHDGGRGRRAAQDVPARDLDLRALDRRLLSARHDLHPVGASRRARSRSSRASTRPSRRPAPRTDCRGSARRWRS